jgi:hypothetical protein
MARGENSCAEHLATAALLVVATSSYVTLRRISTANYGDLPTLHTWVYTPRGCLDGFLSASHA